MNSKYVGTVELLNHIETLTKSGEVKKAELEQLSLSILCDISLSLARITDAMENLREVWGK